MRALVTGGAGYIGSHVARLLSESGWEVTVLDSFEKGHRAAVKGFGVAEGDIRDPDFLERVFACCAYDAVLHFAAFIEVGESVEKPLLYYGNNLGGGLNVLEAAVRAGVRRFIFSSTASVYGMVGAAPITEDAPTAPISPYGQSKLYMEAALESSRKAYGLSYASLRYFNAAGAHPDGTMGEDHRPESHLLPRILKAAMAGQEVTIYGTDYPTPDGTCVRDYIHIIDLARAHFLALDAMKAAKARGEVFNLGNGAGFSVRQIIDRASAISGLPVKVCEGPRRPGDSAVLVASSAKAQRVLGWKGERADISVIIADAWRWHSSHRQGYQGKEKP
jgi:UDP-glucose 4-epimerase